MTFPKLSDDDLELRYNKPVKPAVGEVRKNTITHLHKRVKELAKEIVMNTESSREQSLALTHLDEVLMWTLNSLNKTPE